MDGTRRGVGRTSSEHMVADVRAARDRGGLKRGATRGRESNPARARGRSALLVRLRASAETSRSARTGATRAIAKGGGERARLDRSRQTRGSSIRHFSVARASKQRCGDERAAFGRVRRLDECELNRSRLPHQQLQPMRVNSTVSQSQNKIRRLICCAAHTLSSPLHTL